MDRQLSIMSTKSKIAVLITLTLLCSVATVTWETPQNLLIFVVWGIASKLTIRRIALQQSRLQANMTLAIVLLLMGGTIVAAALAPFKRVDAVREQLISLQQSEMTVAELSEYCQINRDRMPLRILVPAGGNALTDTVTFSALVMPLKQFISEVENQTGCRHHFGGCGNAYSILYGPAYNFGLSFNPQADSGYTWE